MSADDITCAQCGYSSTDYAYFLMSYPGGPRCVKFYACSRRRDVQEVVTKYGLPNDAAERLTSYIGANS
jgi:hypothetical protein